MLVVDPVTKTMVIIAVLLLLGRAGEFIFTRTGVPDMAWLVLAGVVAGPVLKLVPLGILMPVLPFFGAVSLIVILGGGVRRGQTAVPARERGCGGNPRGIGIPTTRAGPGKDIRDNYSRVLAVKNETPPWFSDPEAWSWSTAAPFHFPARVPRLAM
ncbi:hypothetical protein [Oceanidesulfovibrio marinus]|uniref:Uncharacterized protein n=1 Tax=Oceanidesulfovibrio marinus TaxID=370038 RepID=A0ABX6NDN8_9BACT|nr:hypothetical protein [Oceanidesulfovibrio marinus]QJT08718.1 hypothetical protein E8L03_07175 [Oceanidesulfovibrio marinus]